MDAETKRLYERRGIPLDPVARYTAILAGWPEGPVDSLDQVPHGVRSDYFRHGRKFHPNKEAKGLRYSYERMLRKAKEKQDGQA